MGYYISPSPKSKTHEGEAIMCERDACKHEDCAASWKMIDSPCAGCGEPIGEQNPMYFLPDNRFSHFRCAWDENDNWKF